MLCRVCNIELTFGAVIAAVHVHTADGKYGCEISAIYLNIKY